eukprot:gene12776-16033_t
MKNIHLEIAEELSSQEELIGFIMDNTKANANAMKMLEEQNPAWVCIGCGAHAFALIFKDFNKLLKCVWTAEVFATARMMTNTINDSEKVRALIASIQERDCGQRRGFSAHVPTRFAIMLFVMSDLHVSRDSIKAACITDEWSTVSKHATHADDFYQAATGVLNRQGNGGNGGRGRPADRLNFWEEVALAIKLLQPISDAIHQLEADRPMLSQMMPIWTAMLKHADAFVAQEGLPKRYKKGVVEIFSARFTKHYRPAWSAAYLLDPMYFSKDEYGWRPPFSTLCAQQQKDAKERILHFVPVEKRTEAAAEFLKLQLMALHPDIFEAMETLTNRQVVDGKVITAPVAMRAGWWRVQAAPAGFKMSRPRYLFWVPVLLVALMSF